MMICWLIEKTSHMQKPYQVIFRSPLPKITNQESSGYKYKKFYHYSRLSIEHLYQSSIGLDFVEAFFAWISIYD